MISEEEVQHIAKLARLELTAQEIKKMQKDLSLILDYFNVLKRAPQTDAEIHAEERGNELRRDEARHSQLSDEIIGAAPDKKDDHIKVKTIL